MSRSLLDRLGLHRQELRAWAMYDWAKSAFETTIMAAMLPIYFKKVAAAGLAENVSTAYWAYVSSIGVAIVAILSPLLGAIADYTGRQKRLLGAFSLVGIAATACLWYVGQGDWALAALLYVVANIGYAGANVFYDALLPHIASPDEVDRVSTAGYALGYVGGGVLLAVNLVMVLKPELFGFADKGVATRAAFVSVAVWWVVFMIPTLRRVREPAPVVLEGESGHPVRVAMKRLGDTFQHARRFKQVMIFLVSYWFYTDGIGTIIKMATAFGAEIGIGETHLIGALLLVQFLGIPATFAFGALAERIGAKAGVLLSLFVYTGICVLGYFMSEAWHFWALAVLVALVQGGSQALSRSLYATIVPLSKTSEFFAFISVSARFAGIMGPLLFAVVSQVTGESRLSILGLISFFALGIVLLFKLDVDEGKRVAAEAEAEIQRHKAAAGMASAEA